MTPRPPTSTGAVRVRWAGRAALLVAGALLAVWGVRQWQGALQTDDLVRTTQTDATAVPPPPADIARYAETDAIPFPDGAPARAIALVGAVLFLGQGDTVYHRDEGDWVSAARLSGTVRALCGTGDNGWAAAIDSRIALQPPDGPRRLIPVGDNRSVLTAIAHADHVLYVADAGHRCVHVVHTADGRHAPALDQVPDPDGAMVPLVVPSPWLDVAAGPDGVLWIANPGRREVCRRTPEGGWAPTWGGSGMAWEAFCGCCNPLHIYPVPTEGVLADAKGVLTVEKGLCRVKILTSTGRLTALVAGPGDFEPTTVLADAAVDADGTVYLLDPTARRVRVFIPRVE